MRTKWQHHVKGSSPSTQHDNFKSLQIVLNGKILAGKWKAPAWKYRSSAFQSQLWQRISVAAETQKVSIISLFLFSLAICELTDQLDKMVSKGQSQLKFTMILRNALERCLPFRHKCGKILIRWKGESFGGYQEEGPWVWPLPFTTHPHTHIHTAHTCKRPHCWLLITLQK